MAGVKGLFEIYKNEESVSKSVLKKLEEKSPTIKKNSLYDVIHEINSFVNLKLGKYKDDYIIITDYDEYRNYIDKCLENGEVSIDTETMGLDPILDDIVGLCLYTPNMPAAYIPINHVDYITKIRLNNQLTKEQISPLLEQLKDIKIIMFNATFDIRVIKNSLGILFENIHWDCYLAAKSLNENSLENGLKYLHKKYVLRDKEDVFTFGNLFSGITFNLIPIQTAYIYAAHDSLITYELYKYQEQFLNDNENNRQDLRDCYYVFRNIDMAVIDAVVTMEETGFRFDVNYQKEISPMYHKKLNESLQSIYKELEQYQHLIDEYKLKNRNHKLDDPISISSPVQLSVLLYDILNYPQVDKKNPRGTGSDVLEKFNTPLSRAIIDYREAYKLITSFVDTLDKFLNPKTKHVHPRYNIYGAKTGRLSSNGPNAQQIPSHDKYIRKMFAAPLYEREVEVADIIELKDTEEVFINDVWIFASDLKVEDIVEDKKIVKISKDNNIIKLELGD